MTRYKHYVGIPFVWGGRTPEEGFDCYGYIKHLLAEDGIEIPDYKTPEKEGRIKKIVTIFLSELAKWKKCELREGAILLFRTRSVYHVGYYIGNGMFTHTWEESNGVVIERLHDWKFKLAGVYEYQ